MLYNIKHVMEGIIRTTVETQPVDILDQYTVADGDVSIVITEGKEGGEYLVMEPPFTQLAQEAYIKIVKRIKDTTLLDPANNNEEELRKIVYDKFYEIGTTMYSPRDFDGIFTSLKYYLYRNLVGYDILHPMMTDPNIEDILISAPARPINIIHKKWSNRFHALTANVMFQNDKLMVQFINRMFAKTGNEPTVAKPGVVTWLPDKSRISATRGNIISEAR